MPDTKNTPLPPSEVIPFGKYRGQPAEVLLQDPKYAEWLQGQDWFRQRYQSLNIFISNFGQPADTPEHNAIQVKFLDPDFRLKFAVAVAGEDFLTNASNWFVNNAIDTMLSEPDGARGAHVPKDGEALLSIGGPYFESGGVDVGFDVVSGADVWRENHYDGKNYYRSNRIKFFAEIKPSLGDDFPGVLRQMHSLFRERFTGEKHALLYASYHGTGATEEQVVRVFASSGFKMVRLDAVESVFVPPFDTTFERISV